MRYVRLHEHRPVYDGGAALSLLPSVYQIIGQSIGGWGSVVWVYGNKATTTFKAGGAGSVFGTHF